jgi:D-alanine-D-alanine ligase
MRVGLSYDLKEAIPQRPDIPEDALEEYDLPETIIALVAAIESLGHSIVRLGGGKELINNILRQQVDIVFNIAEGLGNYRSREAQVPAILEMLDIPYSGSDPQCLAICLDKPLSKKLVSAAGIRTPTWHVINNNHELNEITEDDILFPVFIKPTHEGSSMGIDSVSKINDLTELEKKVVNMLERYQQPVLVEEFISGDDITVGIIGNSPPKIMGIMRVMPRKRSSQFVYSLEIKRNWEHLVEYECPAKLGERVLEKIEDYSLEVYQILGCRDFARIDFKLGPGVEPYFLEINPLPGLNPNSGDLPIMAYKMGWTYEELIATVLNAAMGRHP